MARFEEVLDGFMEERGIGTLDELATAMHDEYGQAYSGEEVKTILEDPGKAKAEFFYMLTVGLSLDKEQTKTLVRALNEDLKRARLRRAAERM